jgi:hypothetical protein
VTLAVDIEASGGPRHVFNIDVARLMHRHGDEWVEMSPVADRSPDSRDPERKLLAGERAYRCKECDEEISIRQPEPEG